MCKREDWKGDEMERAGWTEIALTSGYVPDAPFADGELSPGYVDGDLALMHEEHHLHLTGVLGHLEAAGWQVNKP